MSCAEIKKEAFERAKTVKQNYLTGSDSYESLPRLKAILNERPDCISYKSLKLTKNELEKIENFYSNFKNDFDLTEQDCIDKLVDTSHMPVIRGQGPLEWCYLESAVQILSFYEKRKISVYDAASKYFRDSEIHKNYILKNERPDQNPNSYISLTWGKMDLAINILSKSSQPLCTEEGFTPSAGEINKFSHKISQFINNSKSCFGWPEDHFFQLNRDILDLLDKASDFNRLSILVDLNCTEKVKIHNYSVEENYAPRNANDKLMSLVDETLTSQKPVAISIDSEMLYSGRNYKSNKNNHTTILVGRRYNHTKQQCEYLLRDSLSTISCDKRISIECEVDVVSGAVDYWIPRTTLKNNLSRVYKVTPQ